MSTSFTIGKKIIQLERLSMAEILMNEEFKANVEEPFETNKTANPLQTVSTFSLCDDANRVDEFGVTPYIRAIINKDSKTAKMYVEHGARYTAGKYGNTPLILAAMYNLRSVVEMILHPNYNTYNDHVVSVDECNSFKFTPLMMACRRGHVEIVECLIKHGANVNLQEGNGVSPLYLAVKRHSLKIVDLLLKAGANVDVQERHNTTPLLYAVKANDCGICAKLVEYGADPNIKDNNGINAITLLEMKIEYVNSKWAPLFDLLLTRKREKL